MSDEFVQNGTFDPESVTDYIAGPEYYREPSFEYGAYIPEADVLLVKTLLEGFAADESDERKRERVEQLGKLKLVERQREILGYTFDSVDVRNVIRIDDALSQDAELYNSIVVAAFEFQQKRLVNLGLSEAAILDHMAHVRGVYDLATNGEQGRRTNLGEVMMALHDVSKYASRIDSKKQEIEVLDEVALGLHETASAIVGSEVMVAIFANGEVKERMMRQMNCSEEEYYQAISALKRASAVFIADHGYLEYPYKEARKSPLDVSERMYVLFGSQLYLDNHREDSELFRGEIAENRDRFLRIKRSINEADMMVGETPRSWVKYHNELKQARMATFYGYESSAAYVATFLPTTFEYYRDAPEDLSLRDSVDSEIDRGVLIVTILDAACSKDEESKLILKAKLKTGLLDDQARIIDLAFNEAEAMNLRFVMGRSGFNQLNLMEQHKKDFANLVDTIAMLSDEIVSSDSNGVGVEITEQRQILEAKYDIVR